MKKIVNFIGIIFTAGIMTGCGANYNVGLPAYDLADKQMENQAKCEEAYAKSMLIDCTGLSEQNCFMLKLQAENVKMIAVATGKNPSPCGQGTNLFDVMKTEVAEKNATARTGINAGAGVVKFGLGVWGATEVVDSIGKNAGNRTTQNVETGDASVSNSRVNSESTAKNFGEEGTANSGGAAPADSGTVTPELPAGTEVVGDGVEVTVD